MARKAAASKIDREGDRDRSHAQAGINDGHFDSRAEERGAVFGGFRERRSVKAGESLDGRQRFRSSGAIGHI